MALKIDFKNQAVRFLIFVVTLLGLIVLGGRLNLDLEKVKDQLVQMPVFLSGICFVALYVSLTMLIWFGPKDFFRISSALVFGPILSTVFVTVAELINAGILFNLSRKLGRGFVQERMKIRQEDIAKAEQKIGWFNAYALRANPLIPLRYLDLAYGLTRISALKYFIVALISTPPRVLWLQAIISLMGSNFMKMLHGLMDDMQAVGFEKAWLHYADTFMQHLSQNQQVLVFAFGYMLFAFGAGFIALVLQIARKTSKSGR